MLLLPRRAAIQDDPGPLAPPQQERALLVRLRPALCLIAACGGWAMVGGPIGLAVGLVCGVTVWMVLARTEDPAVVRRREALVDDLPTGVDLLASCLDAGAAPESALVSVSRALGGPVGGVPRHPSLGSRLASIPRRSGARWRPIRSSGTLVVPSAGHTRPVRRWGRRCTGWPRSSVRAREPTWRSEREASRSRPRHRSVCVSCPRSSVLGVVPMVAGVFGSMDILG